MRSLASIYSPGPMKTPQIVSPICLSILTLLASLQAFAIPRSFNTVRAAVIDPPNPRTEVKTWPTNGPSHAPLTLLQAQTALIAGPSLVMAARKQAT